MNDIHQSFAHDPDVMMRSYNGFCLKRFAKGDAASHFRPLEPP